MDRLKFDECKSCKEWRGCMTDCINTCGKPFDALKEFNRYENLKEQGRLLELPCAVGDTVFVIPSKTNYKLNIVNGLRENNRVYEQIVNRIEISEYGYTLVTCDGMTGVIEKSYRKTWFLNREEAEKALKTHAGNSQ